MLQQHLKELQTLRASIKLKQSAYQQTGHGCQKAQCQYLYQPFEDELAQMLNKLGQVEVQIRQRTELITQSAEDVHAERQKIEQKLSRLDGRIGRIEQRAKGEKDAQKLRLCEKVKRSQQRHVDQLQTSLLQCEEREKEQQHELQIKAGSLVKWGKDQVLQCFKDFGQSLYLKPNVEEFEEVSQVQLPLM